MRDRRTAGIVEENMIPENIESKMRAINIFITRKKVIFVFVRAAKLDVKKYTNANYGSENINYIL